MRSSYFPGIKYLVLILSMFFLFLPLSMCSSAGALSDFFDLPESSNNTILPCKSNSLFTRAFPKVADIVVKGVFSAGYVLGGIRRIADVDELDHVLSSVLLANGAYTVLEAILNKNSDKKDGKKIFLFSILDGASHIFMGLSVISGDGVLYTFSAAGLFLGIAGSIYHQPDLSASRVQRFKSSLYLVMGAVLLYGGFGFFGASPVMTEHLVTAGVFLAGATVFDFPYSFVQYCSKRNVKAVAHDDFSLRPVNQGSEVSAISYSLRQQNAASQ